jgi:plastocyanin
MWLVHAVGSHGPGTGLQRKGYDVKSGRILAALFAVLLLGAACSKGTSASPSTAAGFDSTSQGSGSELPITQAGSTGQGTAQEEGAEGTSEARGEGDSSSAATGPITVIAGAGGQMAFSPSSVSVPQGQTIVVKNAGSVPHTFTVTGQNIDVTVDPGQSQRVAVDLPAGTYDFVCTFHQGMGMTGTLTVT